MKCCKNSYIMRYDDKFFVIVVTKYMNSIIEKRVVDNTRLKYLRKNFNHLDNNIILCFR